MALTLVCGAQGFVCGAWVSCRAGQLWLHHRTAQGPFAPEYVELSGLALKK